MLFRIKSSTVCIRCFHLVFFRNILFPAAFRYALDWWRGGAVTRCVRSTKLLYAGPS